MLVNGSTTAGVASATAVEKDPLGRPLLYDNNLCNA